MLHVLLFLLKIIGFLILGILGLALALVLLVLLVPIRYQIQGSYYGKLEGTVRVTWLLHIISVLASYTEELQISVKLLGFPLARKSGQEAEDLAMQEAEQFFDEAEEGTLHVMEVAEDEVKDPILQRQKVSAEVPESESPPPDIPTEEDGASKSRIPGFVNRIVEKIVFIVQGICDKIRYLNQKKEEALAFLADQDNQNTLKLICRQGKRLLKHLLPQKARGSVTFGFDDPYTTGQVLTAAAVFYGWYGDSIQITPVFDEQIMEGELLLKGRIRIGTVLVLGVRVFLNKNFRILYKKWRSKGGVSDGR